MVAASARRQQNRKCETQPYVELQTVHPFHTEPHELITPLLRTSSRAQTTVSGNFLESIADQSLVGEA